MAREYDRSCYLVCEEQHRHDHSTSDTKAPPRPPPGESAHDGARSRDAILRQAASLATVEGINGLSLSRLADAVGMSKSGIYAHFGSKEDLQLATVAMAGEILGDEVIVPAMSAETGIERLLALLRPLPGPRARQGVRGLLLRGLDADRAEYASRARYETASPRSATDSVASSRRRSRQLREAGEIDADADAEQLAFELNAYLFMANTLYARAVRTPSSSGPAQRCADRLQAAAA